MKVKELIEKLQKFNPEDIVNVANYGDDDMMWDYEPETVEDHFDLYGKRKLGIILRV
jgi:hypothetical protein